METIHIVLIFWLTAVDSVQGAKRSLWEASECRGSSQSPINIPRSGLPKVSVPPLELHDYHIAPETTTLLNDGYTVKMLPKPFKPSVTPHLSGGGLRQEYRLAYGVFHWGASDREGSEHKKSHTAFPMELQLVHYKEGFPDLNAALKEAEYDSLAILSVFYSVQLRSLVDLPSFDLLIAGLENITKPSSRTQVTSFPLADLLPEELDGFYLYNGSLTEPNHCPEVVQWIVVKKPVYCSLAQLTSFRTLQGNKGQLLGGNFRPVQPVREKRMVLDATSFSSETSASTSSSRGHNIWWTLLVTLASIWVTLASSQVTPGLAASEEYFKPNLLYWPLLIFIPLLTTE